MGKFKELTGKRFGRLTVLERVEGSKPTRWICKCDCGAKKEIRVGSLRPNKTKSCGCLRKEVISKAFSTHGLSFGKDNKKTRLYICWKAMRSRCLSNSDNRFHRYGARGIKICKEWDDYKNFHVWATENGYEEHLTLERIDNDGDYMPSNCKWVTHAEQALNRSNNVWAVYKGKKVAVRKLCLDMKVDPGLVIQRLRNGWEIERAISEPSRQQKKKEG